MLLAGCGSGGGLLGGLTGGDCSPHTASINFPSAGGFITTGTITAATGCLATATITTNAGLFPVEGLGYSPPSGGQVVLYLGITFSATEYLNGLPSLTITMPATVATANRKFYVAANSSGGGSFGWLSALEGPVAASGSTISFAAGGGNTTFDAGTEEELAVYSVSGP